MTRKRVHELAKEWGLQPKDVLAKLERLGVKGKKPQSSLLPDEVEMVKKELALSPPPTIALGEERVVAERVVTETDAAAEQLVTAREKVVESRIRPNVIRRRTSRVDIQRQDLPRPQPGGEISAEPEGLLARELGHAEPEPPPKEEVVDGQSEVPEAVGPEEERVVEPPRPGRVLGKIDLHKPPPPEIRQAEEARPPAEIIPFSERAREKAKEVGKEELPTEGEEAEKPRKKRRIIKKRELLESQEREHRLGRIPKKKRALPGKEQKKTEITIPRASKRVVKISGVIPLGDLARAMGAKANEVIKKLMNLGVMATINNVLDMDTAILVASEFDYTVENVAFDAESALEGEHGVSGDVKALEPRPPVITIMGHVDHGKTSLLDAIRETNVTAQEAGGITQHIGAYSVQVNGRRVTFLDTPGHEAFTAMRARGAKVTDMVVLVVAADDGVMPQTVEAINHARAAGVPILVAINKIDKPDADVERTKRALADHGVVPEEWGGDTIVVPVSAKTKKGISQLLEMLLLQAEVLELRADTQKLARGVIVEAKLDRGRGPVATVLVQEGRLTGGTHFVCGTEYGRVRAMMDEWGRKIAVAGPSMPVEILGLTGVPEAGDSFVAVSDEAKARQVADFRRAKQREVEMVKTSKVSLEDLYQQIRTGNVKELPVVVKADVQGSVEALGGALSRLSLEEVKLTVLHASVGGISESDVLLASASNAIIIGFNVRPEAKAAHLADQEGVEIRLYTVIYDVVNDIRDAIEGLLEPTFQERTVGRAEVRQIFAVSQVGAVAGCVVTEGKMVRGARVRLIRDHVVVYEGKITSLKHFKEDIHEAVVGYECGIGLENYADIKIGDVIEIFEMEEVARRRTPHTPRSPEAEHRL